VVVKTKDVTSRRYFSFSLISEQCITCNLSQHHRFDWLSVFCVLILISLFLCCRIVLYVLVAFLGQDLVSVCVTWHCSGICHVRYFYCLCINPCLFRNRISYLFHIVPTGIFIHHCFAHHSQSNKEKSERVRESLFTGSLFSWNKMLLVGEREMERTS
jgi:hypothetical protein